MAIAAHSSPQGDALTDEAQGARRRAAARGRHATPRGSGFGYVVGWSILGTLLPGAGLVAAGRKALGWTLVTLCVLAGAAVVAFFALKGDSPLDAAMSLVGAAVDTTTLLVLAGAIAVLGLLWVLVVVGTHVALRRRSVLSGGQKALSTVLVAALVGLVAAPVAYAGDLALVQRSLIQSVFGSTDPDPKPVGEGPQAEEADPWANMPRVNVLLIGSDAGADRDGIRPDTLILASIDTTSGDTVLFSLPRNLEHAQFPPGTDGYEAWGTEGFSCPNNECMINAVWSWADNQSEYYQDAPEPGLQATMDAVAGTLGLPVNQYALVDLRGFQKVVDAMGGITINVQRTVPIGGGKSLSGRSNPIKGYIEAGPNRKLDGYHALWYARSRDGSTDYDRMSRQRCVIGAIIEKADPLTLVQAYPRLAAAAKEDIATDVPQADLSAWVKLALRVKDGSIRSLPFDDKVVANRANPDFERIQALVQQALLPPAATPTTPTTPTTQEPSTPAQQPTAPPTQAPADPGQAQDVSEVC